MEPLTLFIILIILVACSAFYAASEIAIVSLQQSDVADIRKKFPKLGKHLDFHRDNAQRFVINISIANNFINILASSLATATLVALFPKYGVLMATVGMTFFILLFGEIIPKVLAISHTKYIAQKSATPLWISAIVLTPFIWVFSLVVKLITSSKPAEHSVSADAVKFYIQKGFESGSINFKEREYIQNIMKMDMVHAKDIMTPQGKVISLNAQSTVGHAVTKLKRSGFSRVPVYEDRHENIIGMIHVKDLLQKKHTSKIKQFVRQAYFVPEVRKVDDLLQDFQKEDTHFAIVMDVDGHYVGILTIEDVIEEIVGEIYDESDRKVVYLKKINNKTYHIQGDFDLSDFNKKFKTRLTGAHSIGGYIVNKLERLPRIGERVNFTKGYFEVMQVSTHKVKKIKFLKKSN